MRIISNKEYKLLKELQKEYLYFVEMQKTLKEELIISNELKNKLLKENTNILMQNYELTKKLMGVSK